MDALHLLLNRCSEKSLTSPAPSQQQLNQILQAAMHVPDHHKLRPYHFIVMEKQGLMRFQDLLIQAVTELKLDKSRIAKAKKLSQSAPMIIAIIAKIDQNNPKVRTWEQLLSAGCATYSMQLAANAQGFSNVWITGIWVESEIVRQAFNCKAEDKIIGFLMLGTAKNPAPADSNHIDTTTFTTYL